MKAIAAALREDFGSRRLIAISLALSVLAAIGGPFGWYDHVPFILRLLFWLTAIGVSRLVSSVARGIVRGVLGWHGFWRGALSIAVITALCLSPAVLIVAQSVFHRTNHLMVQLSRTAALIFAISLTASMFRHFFFNPPEPATKSMPRLLRRIEPAAQGELIRLSVRDHYVDVVTTAGQTSLLMRLSDAIAETEGLEGLQVHRSHWVAVWAIGGVERANGRLVLRMCDGAAVPVSRNYRAGLVERGLV